MAQEWSLTGPKVIDIGDEQEQVAIVSVTLVAGRVDVITHDDSPTARLEVQDVSGPPLIVRWDGTTLKVNHLDESGDYFMGKLKSGLHLGGSKISARLSLSVPSTAVVSTSTVSADTLVNGSHNDVRTATVSGTVTLDDIRGSVRANTVSGDVEAHQLEGRLKANTVSGAMTVQASTLDTISLNTVSGDITLDLLSAKVDVRSTSVSGDVTLRVPAGSGYSVNAHTMSGHVVIDGVAVPGRNGGGKGGRGGIRAEGDEALTISASSLSGNVVVLRNRPMDSVNDGGHDVPALQDDPQDVSDLPVGEPDGLHGRTAEGTA